MPARSSFPPKPGRNSGLLECYDLLTLSGFLLRKFALLALVFGSLVMSSGLAFARLAFVRLVFVRLALIQRALKLEPQRTFALVQVGMF
jgi:hypothetical protein